LKITRLPITDHRSSIINHQSSIINHQSLITWMSSTTITPGRTVRTVRPLPESRNRFERGMWLYMRYSGLALVFLALSHFWMQHVLIGTHQIEVTDTLRRWGIQGDTINVDNIIWRIYYAAILILAVTHGINGVRQVTYDYFAQRPLVYKGLMSVIVVIAALISLGGILALFVGASSLGATAMR
jgi:succinate dehydrogenase / fumarate reductase membrane anchor subunit